MAAARKLGWGILGCGNFARRRILPALAASDNAWTAALQRRRQDEAEATAREFGVPRGCSSRDALLDAPAVEAVFVGSHNAGHLADVLAALARRKPVLCEKPLGLNARECARMLEAAAKSGAKLFVGHCNRYRDAVEQARGLLAAGRLGRLQSLRVWYSFLCRADAWRRDSRLSGGGPLLDLGPHLIDFARYVTGGEFEEAAAAVEPGLDAAGGQSENWARALLKLRGGTPVTMEVSFQEPLANGFELRGSAAHLRGEYCLSNVEGPLVKLELLTGDPSPMQATPLPPARREVYRLQIEEATRAILEPDFVPRCATGLDGLRVAQAIDAIYAAGRSGTREKIAAH